MADITVITLLTIFLIGIIMAYYFGYRNGIFFRDRYWESQLPEHRKDAIAKSRAVLGGQFSEQLAPFLPNFNYNPTECRFLGKPVDLVVFRGMDGKDISEVVFVEIKSGNSKLSVQEKKLKEAIDRKRVRWEEYRIPEELTKKRDLEESF